MDAQNLTFPSEYFDYVMAFHVVSVVPDHQRMLAELADDLRRKCGPRCPVILQQAQECLKIEARQKDERGAGMERAVQHGNAGDVEQRGNAKIPSQSL